MIEIKDPVILRDGEPIGTIDGDEVTSAKPIHHKAKAAIEAIVGKALKYEFKEDQTGFEKEEAVPTAPSMDYRGDKTPAYVEWYRANHSNEEFQRKYANRKLE